MGKYKLLPEHEAQIPEHNKKWIDIIMDTKRLSEKDKELCVSAVNSMYDIAKLERPKKIVFVSSPVLLAFAGGLIRFILKNRSATDSSTRSAIDSSTYSAIDSATYSATDSSTYSATRSAIDSATYSSTDSATYSATRSAIDSSTRSATSSATYSAIDSATSSSIDSATSSAIDSATEVSVGVVSNENYWDNVKNICNEMGIEFDEAIKYIRGVTCIWQGGCNWGQYDCFLSFFQDIAKLDIDYNAYRPYRDLTVAGYRILDREFAMISEKPIYIKTKDTLPHCFDGPAIEYMDGLKFYMLYGNLVPSWIITTPLDELTKDKILGEENADYRRYLIERIGIEKYIEIIGVKKVLDTFVSEVGGTYELLVVDLNGTDIKFLKMKNRSENVWHIEGVPNEVCTVKDAIKFRNGLVNFKEPKAIT